MSTKINKKPKSNIGNIFLLLSIILLPIAIFYNQLLGTRIELIIGLIGLLLFLIGMMVRHNGVKIPLAIINILISGALVYSQMEFNRMFNYEDKEIHTVSLVVMANSSIKTEADTKGKSFARFEGFNQDSYKNFLQNKDETLGVSKNLKEYDSLEETLKDFYDEKFDVLVLDEGYRDIITEEYEKFDTDTRVIVSVEQVVEKGDEGPVLPETNIEPPAIIPGHDAGKDPEETGTSEPLPPKTDPIKVGRNSFTVLISGVDMYSNRIQAISRSDVNLLMSVNMDTHQVALASIPRDAFMPISCFGNNWDKITHSGLGGVRCTQKSIANYFNIPIDYYAKVNFTSLMRIIDIVGPIQVYSHYTFTGHSGTRFIKGINTLSGSKALEFSRTRKTVPGGDFTRGIHQMEVIKGMIAKLSSVNSVLNLNNLVTAISRNVDTNIPSSIISKLIASQLQSGGWKVVSQSQLKGRGILTRRSYKIPNQNIYVMLPYDSSVRNVRRSLSSVIK